MSYRKRLHHFSIVLCTAIGIDMVFFEKYDLGPRGEDHCFSEASVYINIIIYVLTETLDTKKDAKSHGLYI